MNFFSFEYIKKRDNKKRSNLKNIKRFLAILNSYNEFRILKFNIEFFFFIKIIEHLFKI